MIKRTTVHRAFWSEDSARAWARMLRRAGWDDVAYGFRRTGWLRRFHITMQAPATPWVMWAARNSWKVTDDPFHVFVRIDRSNRALIASEITGRVEDPRWATH